MAKRMYKIAFAPAALRQLRKLPKPDQQRIMRAIQSLEDDPRPPNSKKLQGAESFWRIRVGDYRVVYEIQDSKLIVFVLRIANRKDVYRQGK